ncbi:hypothetical protein DBV15_04428 [Temnothorax longispinosus]|uniref:Uncharacterized protein n=1 Tax=Temnothorax longispinosus TaxID=300112 RepID=A0A4S2K8V9_9HYME|nr:hypothetical protein DBV15_04428 [Temnothorax longispinosus]
MDGSENERPNDNSKILAINQKLEKTEIDVLQLKKELEVFCKIGELQLKCFYLKLSITEAAYSKKLDEAKGKIKVLEEENIKLQKSNNKYKKFIDNIRKEINQLNV